MGYNYMQHFLIFDIYYPNVLFPFHQNCYKILGASNQTVGTRKTSLSTTSFLKNVWYTKFSLFNNNHLLYTVSHLPINLTGAISIKNRRSSRANTRRKRPFFLRLFGNCPVVIGRLIYSKFILSNGLGVMFFSNTNAKAWKKC